MGNEMSELIDYVSDDFDQGSDIEIPIIEITKDWTVDDIQTLDDCDDAHAYLTGAVCSIEDKIEAAIELGTDAGIGFRRLKRALRWKKAALNVVQTKRGKITRALKKVETKEHEKRIINRMRDMFPKEFASIIKHSQDEV
jgi:hypothetical protein